MLMKKEEKSWLNREKTSEAEGKKKLGYTGDVHVCMCVCALHHCLLTPCTHLSFRSNATNPTQPLLYAEACCELHFKIEILIEPFPGLTD